MHHFVLFCEKKKSMSRKKTLLFVYKVCLTLCKLLDLFKQPNKILKLRLNLSTCLLKPFLCRMEANELPSFVKVTFFLFWSNSQHGLISKLLSCQWNASIKNPRHVSWAGVFFSLSKKVLAHSFWPWYILQWFPVLFLKTNKQTCFWSKWRLSNICFFLLKQRTMFLFLSTQSKCSSFFLLSFQRQFYILSCMFLGLL